VVFDKDKTATAAYQLKQLSLSCTWNLNAGALASFEQSIEVCERYQLENHDEALRRTLQAGVVQHFEFTYELCWKFMKRWLQHNLGRSEVEGGSRRELFRLAVEFRLIDNVDTWMTFHAARNQTNHNYDQIIANEVFAVTKVFFPQAQGVFVQLQAKND